MQVDFYELGRTPLPRILARIAGRILDDGGRLLIVTADEEAAATLDAALWDGEESFLPHGREGADQPILIAADCAAANGARHVALADGVWRDEALAFDRAFHLFDEAAKAAAREAWRMLAGVEGVTRNFWKQDEEGRWSRVA